MSTRFIFKDADADKLAACIFRQYSDTIRKRRTSTGPFSAVSEPKEKSGTERGRFIMRREEYQKKNKEAASEKRTRKENKENNQWTCF